MRPKQQMEKYLMYALHTSKEELLRIFENSETKDSDLEILEEAVNDSIAYFKKKRPSMTFIIKIIDYESALGGDE